MRINLQCRGLFTQREPLLHAKAVLLVDNNKPELGVLNLTLKKRVSAHENLAFAARHAGQLLSARLALLFATMPANLDAER